MNLKRLLNTNILLLTQPAKAWMIISRKNEKNSMLKTYLYPMTILCCIATFIGVVTGNGFSMESLYPAIIRMVVKFLTIIFSYHIVAYISANISNRFANEEQKPASVHTLICYSMAVVLLLDICLGIFPNFRIIGWIAQFYTVKIVWDGAALLMRIPEDNRLGYTMFLSALIIFTPIITDSFLSFFTENLI